MPSGLADLEAHGHMVLANPDFVARLKADAPINEADRGSLFDGGAQGYAALHALCLAQARRRAGPLLHSSALARAQKLQAAWSAKRWISQAAAGPGGVSVRYIAWKA